MDTLSGWLNDKELLLILDNCEHLIDMCAQFAHDVLSTSPNVRILASSREALDIAGELVYRVPALETPDLQTTLPVEQLTRYAAARLFVERAAFALSTFSVSEAEAPLIAQICRQLDGIPLAIELAAARLRNLTLEEIAAGLDDRFSLLTRGNRAAPPRHQTLRSLIDWSYEMLSNAERLLLRRLSVFMGGWTLEAAESVCDNPNMLALLIHLVDKSLVAVDLEHGEEPHYYLLETIRQYAREKLAEGGENESIRNRHMKYFCQLVERFEPGLRGPDQVILLDGLERELDNLRAALEWSLDHGVSTGLRLVSGLKWFWHLRSHWREGADWLDKLLRVEAETHSFRSDSESDAFYRAKTLLAVTFLAGVLSEVQKGRVSAAESLAICEKLDRANCASLIAENYLFLGLISEQREQIRCC
jgi:predicted ATPase